MERSELAQEASRAGRNARHNLRWMQKHPERIDENKRADMEDYLNKMISFSREEKKNARLAGLTRLRCRLSNLVVSIVAHNRAE